MPFTNKLAKPLSALALALAFSNAAQAAIIEYKYSNSDATNSITANFFIDDSKATNNLVSGTFALNGTSYTASSTLSEGFINASNLNSQFNTFTGYSYKLVANGNASSLEINNYFVTNHGKTTQVFYGAFNNSYTEDVTRLDGATGTLSKVTAAITPVPEAETYAMMLLGLGLMGFTVLRKKQVV